MRTRIATLGAQQSFCIILLGSSNQWATLSTDATANEIRANTIRMNGTSNNLTILQLENAALPIYMR